MLPPVTSATVFPHPRDSSRLASAAATESAPEGSATISVPQGQALDRGLHPVLGDQGHARGELPEEGKHLRGDVGNGDAVADRPTIDLHRPAGFEAPIECGAARRLDRHDPDGRLCRPKSGTDPREQAAASYRYENGFDLRKVLQDLEAEAPVTRHHVAVRPGMNEGVRLVLPAFLAEVAEHLGHRNQHRLPAVGADRVDLGRGGGLRHQAPSAHSEVPRRPGEGLRGVARAHGRHPPTAYVLGERCHRVEDTAELERAHGLERLELEVEPFGVEPLVGGYQGGAAHGPTNPLAGFRDLLQGGKCGHDVSAACARTEEGRGG